MKKFARALALTMTCALALPAFAQDKPVAGEVKEGSLQGKTLTFVSYGGISGGLRAVEQLRLVFGELHAAPIRDGVAFADVWSRFDAEGALLDADRAEQAMATMLAQLHWWASALRKARETVPYGQFAAA